MAVVLYDDGVHKCVVFTDLVAGEGVQANQFAISHHGEGVLLDPGGNLTYKHLLAEISDYFFAIAHPLYFCFPPRSRHHRLGQWLAVDYRCQSVELC